MSKRLISIFIVLALVCFVTALFSGCAVTNLASFDAATQEQLEAALDKLMADNEIPGAVVGVWAPGRGIWISAKGTGDIATGEPIEGKGRFRIAGITKSFVAIVVLQLAQEGKLSLDDRLAGYEIGSGVPNAESITVRQLLNHTSGVFDYTGDDAFARKYLTEPLTKWSPRQIIDIAAAHRPDFPPGEGWSYSDTNYILLQGIVEQVTGRSLAAELQERIFDALGFKSTSYPNSPEMAKPFSRGYVKDAGATGQLLKAAGVKETTGAGELLDYTLRDPSGAAGSGAIVSNLDDLKLFGEALARGKLLSAGSLEQQLTWVPTGRDEYNDYGLGVMRFGNLIGHAGDMLGYSSNVSHDPSMNLTIVVLLNKDPDEKGHQQAAILLTKQMAQIVDPKVRFTGMTP